MLIFLQKVVILAPVSSMNDFTLSLNSILFVPFCLSIDMTIKKYILTSSREFGTPFVGWMTCITYVEYAHAGFTVVVVTPFVEDGVGAHNCGGL